MEQMRGHTGHLSLTEIAFKVLEMIFDLFRGARDRHGDNFTRNDGLLAATANKTKMLIVIVLAEGFSVLRREKLSSQAFLANCANKVVRMIGFVECVDGRSFNGLFAVATRGTERLLPMLSAVSVAVDALANASVFELALAHLAQQMINMPQHIERLQVRAINMLLTSSANTSVLHDGKIYTDPKIVTSGCL